MTSKPGNDVVHQDQQGKTLTPREQVAKYAASFAKVLPHSVGLDAEAFMAIVNAQLQRKADLRDAVAVNPMSMIHALLDCATLGHLPDGEHYALTVRKVWDRDLKREIPTVVGIEGYVGILDRIYRAAGARSVKVQLVHANDQFEWDPNQMEVPVHKFNALASDKARGDIIGVYAYAVLSDNSVSQMVIFNQDDLERRAAAAPKGSPMTRGAWPKEWAQKTALRRLRKFVPVSRDYRDEMVKAAVERQRQVAQLPPSPVEYSPEADPDLDGDAGWADPVDVGQGEDTA